MIVVRVRLTVKQENQDEFLACLNDEARKNKTLKGCLSYALYQDVSEPTDFMLYEEWDSMDSFTAYKDSEAFSILMATLPALLHSAPDSAYYESQIVGP